MTKFKRLKKEAKEACEFRHHTMTNFKTHKHLDKKRKTGIAICKDCDMWVIVRTHPLPNEIEIGGEAVALNCPKETRG